MRTAADAPEHSNLFQCILQKTHAVFYFVKLAIYFNLFCCELFSRHHREYVINQTFSNLKLIALRQIQWKCVPLSPWFTLRTYSFPAFVSWEDTFIFLSTSILIRIFLSLVCTDCVACHPLQEGWMQVGREGFGSKSLIHCGIMFGFDPWTEYSLSVQFSSFFLLIFSDESKMLFRVEVRISIEYS